MYGGTETLDAAPFELEELGLLDEPADAVPELTGILAHWDLSDDRAENTGAFAVVEYNGRNAKGVIALDDLAVLGQDFVAGRGISEGGSEKASVQTSRLKGRLYQGLVIGEV